MRPDPVRLMSEVLRPHTRSDIGPISLAEQLIVVLTDAGYRLVYEPGVQGG